MTQIRIIGDVHAMSTNSHIDLYKQLIGSSFIDGSIQVGDFGIQEWPYMDMQTVNGKSIRIKHWINGGNHDNPIYFDMPFACGNWKFFDSWDLMTVRGARSVDKAHRNEGIDWWPTEQLSHVEGNEFLGAYEALKPRFVVSHDCPTDVRKKLMGYDKPSDESFTCKLLQEAFNIHKPEIWFFGHHHRNYMTSHEGTTFMCLDELQYYDLVI
jgi:hypothetical protein